MFLSLSIFFEYVQFSNEMVTCVLYNLLVRPFMYFFLSEVTSKLLYLQICLRIHLNGHDVLKYIEHRLCYLDLCHFQGYLCQRICVYFSLLVEIAKKVQYWTKLIG